MHQGRKLPKYAFNSPEITRINDEHTRQGDYDLLPFEERWRDRQPELQRRGYSLRPRYQKNWTPSWTGTNIDPFFCEDSVRLEEFEVIDASREDGTRVAIKSLPNIGQEVEVAQFLTSLRHPHNHCVPILDVFPDPLSPNTQMLLVMPYLVPFDDPEFAYIGEVFDFMSQMLEGLEFMHRHRVVHRDIASINVMMDGSPLYPSGHHPVRNDYSIDAIYPVKPLHRIDHPVRYYYIDFGFSVRFTEGAPSLVVGDIGRDASVPELSSTVPYDGYKADIHALGTLFEQAFEEKFHGLEFLKPLIVCMKQPQPETRPAAPELVTMFRQICAQQGNGLSRRRLKLKAEPVYERVFNTYVVPALEGLTQLTPYAFSGT